MTKKKPCHELNNKRSHHWVLEPPSPDRRYSKGKCKNCGYELREYFDNRPDLSTKTQKGQRVKFFSINGRPSFKSRK